MNAIPPFHSVSRALLTLPSRHFTAEAGARELLEELIEQLPNLRSKIEQLVAASAVLRLPLATIRASHRNHHDEPFSRIPGCLRISPRMFTNRYTCRSLPA